MYKTPRKSDLCITFAGGACFNQFVSEFVCACTYTCTGASVCACQPKFKDPALLLSRCDVTKMRSAIFLSVLILLLDEIIWFVTLLQPFFRNFFTSNQEKIFPSCKPRIKDVIVHFRSQLQMMLTFQESSCPC